MAWTSSEIFRAFIADVVENIAAFDVGSGGDTIKVPLYNNSITPDQDAAAASTAYNTGQWANTNEVYEAGEWAQGGQTLGTQSVNRATAATVFMDADDTASTGSTADLANVYGCLVYSDTLTTPVADQGICFNYFGGVQSVTNGTFTVVWDANGIWRITL
jgi:hypothetical protein